MGEGRISRTHSRAHSHIIKRPRLTKLLDESEARIILLVAPAGYGKTTLAREWLEGKSGVAWYDRRAEMSDVAALAFGLGEAISEATRSRRPESIRRLHRLARLDRDPLTLARAILAATDNCEVLVIEDCHATGEGASDALLATLVPQAPCRVVLTSRTRPPWVEARMTVYGEVTIIDSAALAFTPTEAEQVLWSASNETREQVVAKAEGWPAAIGLAAMRSKVNEQIELPKLEDLYRFFADDIFEHLEPKLFDALLLLALGGDADDALAGALLSEGWEPLLAAGVEAGFVGRGASGRLQIHPLLRDFLIEKLRERPCQSVEDAVAHYVQCAANQCAWDNCLLALEAFPNADLVASILRRCLRDSLEAGRVETVRRWLQLGERLQLDDAVMLLAEAEVALREGDNESAQALGARSATLGLDGEVVARSHLVAARAAHLRDDGPAVRYHAEAAADSAATTETEVSALWIGLSSAVERGDVSARAILARLEAIDDASPEHALRVCNARGYLIFESDGDARGAMREYDLAEPLLRRVRDPFVRTTYLNHRAYVAAASGHYEAAIAIADQEISEAQVAGLDFVIDHGLVTQATALIGLRKLGAAQRKLDILGARPRSKHVQAIGDIQLAKLRIALGDLDRAQVVLRKGSELHPDVAPSLRQEALAYRTLVSAARGDVAAAASDLEDAADWRYPLALVVREHAAAIIRLRKGAADAGREAARTIVSAVDGGHIDITVTALRAYPKLAEKARAESGVAEALMAVLGMSRDSDLARRAGLEIPRQLRRNDGLSDREREVYEHVVQGRSNREIARALFISESTTKVHVRHIFEKLGVHTRAEAARLANRETD